MKEFGLEGALSSAQDVHGDVRKDAQKFAHDVYADIDALNKRKAGASVCGRGRGGHDGGEILAKKLSAFGRTSAICVW